jgi:hypothetical protein
MFDFGIIFVSFSEFSAGVRAKEHFVRRAD